MAQEKGSRWRPTLPVILVGVVAVLALLFSLFREMGIVGTWRLYRTQKQVVEENARLRDENERLSREVTNLRTNPAAIEEIARKELGLIGDKEKVIVLDRKKDASSPSPAKGGTGRP